MAAPAQTNLPTTALDATNGLRDIKAPLIIPTGWEWLWWVLGLMVLVALVAGLVLYFLTRRRQIAAPPLIPPHLRAKERLADALALIGQPKPFVIAVSDALRWYLEERFSFRAPERTTEEFLHELKRTELLLPDQKESLGEFLQRCDLVKFARYEPGEPELRSLHGAAVQLVTETEPHPGPAAPPAHGQVEHPQRP
jgi:hypothetical protein